MTFSWERNVFYLCVSLNGCHNIFEWVIWFFFQHHWSWIWFFLTQKITFSWEANILYLCVSLNGSHVNLDAFSITWHPAVPNLKQILMKNWHLIQKQPLLKEIVKEPPLISHKRGRSLKDVVARSNYAGEWLIQARKSRAGLSTYFYISLY